MIKAATRVGFTHEGTLRGGAWVDGAFAALLFLSGSMAKVLTLSVVLIILMLRPQGLFATKVRR